MHIGRIVYTQQSTGACRGHFAALYTRLMLRNLLSVQNARQRNHFHSLLLSSAAASISIRFPCLFLWFGSFALVITSCELYKWRNYSNRTPSLHSVSTN